LLRLRGERRKREADSENDHDPISRMGTSVEDGRRESSRRVPPGEAGRAGQSQPDCVRTVASKPVVQLT